MVLDEIESRDGLEKLIIFVTALFVGIAIGLIYAGTVIHYISIAVFGPIFLGSIELVKLILKWRKEKKEKQRKEQKKKEDKQRETRKWLKSLETALNCRVLNELEKDIDNIVNRGNKGRLQTLSGNLKKLYTARPQSLDEDISSSLDKIVKSLNSETYVIDYFQKESSIEELCDLRDKVEERLEDKG